MDDYTKESPSTVNSQSSSGNEPSLGTYDSRFITWPRCSLYGLIGNGYIHIRSEYRCTGS